MVYVPASALFFSRFIGQRKFSFVEEEERWQSWSIRECGTARLGPHIEPRYVELGYLEHPAISNCSWLSLAQINPGYLELYYVPKKRWSTLVRKCSQGTSWQDVQKAEKRSDVHGNEAKSDWLDLPLRMQKATSCRYLLILGIKLFQIFDANLALEPPLSRTIFRYSWEFELAGFYSKYVCVVTGFWFLEAAIACVGNWLAHLTGKKKGFPWRVATIVKLIRSRLQSEV